MLAFFEHPDQWARLRADLGLAHGAAEEIVRWVSPVNLFRRTATRDTEIRGQRIAEGDSNFINGIKQMPVWFTPSPPGR